MNTQIQGTADFVEAFAKGYARAERNRDRITDAQWARMSKEDRVRFADTDKGYSAGWFARNEDDRRNASAAESEAMMQRETEIDNAVPATSEWKLIEKEIAKVYLLKDDMKKAMDDLLGNAVGQQFPKEG